MAENQEHIEAQLCAYIDGELDAKGRAEIEKHLANNPQHQRLIAGLIESREMMRSLPRENAPDDIVESVQHSLERSVLLADVEDDAIAMPRRIVRGSHMMLAAAIVLLTIGLGVVIYFVLPSSGRQGQIAVVTPPAKDAATPASRGIDARKFASDGTPTIPEIASKTATRDPFTARGGAESKAGAPQVADALSSSNTFNDQAKAKADGQLVLVVNTDNPTVTNGQVTSYLVSNGIAWQNVSEPMPPPLEISQSQVVEMSRLNQTHVQLRGGAKEERADNSVSLDQAAQAPGTVTGAGGASTQPTLNFAITPTTSPASPTEMVYQYFGFGQSNLEQAKATNRIFANMTRRQAEELSETLQKSRSGQRALVYGRQAYDVSMRGALATSVSDKVAQNYKLTRPQDSEPTPPATVAVTETTQPTGSYTAKAPAVPLRVESPVEVATKQLDAQRRIAPGGAKVAEKEAAPTTVTADINLSGQQQATAAPVGDRLQDQKKLPDQAPTVQTAGVEKTFATQPTVHEPLLEVFICVNKDAATTEPSPVSGAATQPSLDTP